MNDPSFVTLIKANGRYRTAGEATRAANAVFGTIKSWLSPAASDKVRRVLSGDALVLWQYSPVPRTMGHSQERLTGLPVKALHFLLKIQQHGGYESSSEAQRAACSVLGALATAAPVDPAKFMARILPPEVLGICRLSGAGRAA